MCLGVLERRDIFLYLVYLDTCKDTRFVQELVVEKFLGANLLFGSTRRTLTKPRARCQEGPVVPNLRIPRVWCFQ